MAEGDADSERQGECGGVHVPGPVMEPQGAQLIDPEPDMLSGV